jgi:hypothetical protein
MKVADDELRAKLKQRDYLTSAEGAILIRRDKSTVNRWISNGLTTVRIGTKRFVNRKELLRWAADPDRRTRRRPTND